MPIRSIRSLALAETAEAADFENVRSRLVGCLLAIGTAFIAGSFSNLMDYIQALFSFFNGLCSLSSFWVCSKSG